MDKLQNLQPWQQVQGVYVHIPFCRQKCLYCDFNSYAGFGAEAMAKYAAAVCREIAGRRKDVPLNANASIYFGGGQKRCASKRQGFNLFWRRHAKPFTG